MGNQMHEGEGPNEIHADQNSIGEPHVEHTGMEEPYDPIRDPRKNSLMIMEADSIENFH